MSNSLSQIPHAEQQSTPKGQQYPETHSFRPQIHKKSQLMHREKSIEEHLYEDFLERRKKQELVAQGMEAHFQQRVIEHAQRMFSSKSEQYLIQRFTKEIVTLWQQSLEVDEENQSNETMDLPLFKELLLRLGFVDQKYLLDEKAPLVQLIWQNLGGLAKDQITLNNVRIFLLAVMGTYIEPGLNRDEQNLQRLDNDFGLFNDFGDLFLEPVDVPKIQRLYQPLYTMRMQHEARQRALKRRERSETSEYQFTPKVTSKSREMAQRFRDKLQQEMQGRLNSIDFLRQPAKDPKFAEVASLLIQKEELKECTFKPQINQFRSPKSKKSPILT